VSGAYPIECLKPDRLKLHYLFNDMNPANSIGSVNAANPSFRPTYEDTFDAIEEFLLNALYDDWRVFMDTEEKIFRHVTLKIKNILNICNL
jgi:hypothetical protein